MLRRSPAEVLIGREANGRTEVLAGLAPGGKVITSGQFLLDSEASLAGLDVRGIDEASPGASGGDTKQAQRPRPKEYSANGPIEKIAPRTRLLRNGPEMVAGGHAMKMTFSTTTPAQFTVTTRRHPVSCPSEQTAN